MKHKDYMNITMAIFLVIGVLHLYRAFNNTPVMFGHTVIPIWASWIAGAAGLYLAYSAHKLRS